MDERLGFIHEKLDIKILILFVLRRLSRPVDPSTLLELCQCDGGVGYFDYSDCLHELIRTGHILETDECYQITEKGKRNSEAVESSLPYSVRAKAENMAAAVDERLRREAMIYARHEVSESGMTVKLGMSDGKGEVISMSLLCFDEEQAKRIEKNFRKNAAAFYSSFLEQLEQGKENEI